MFIWIRLMHTQFCDNAPEELGYNIIMAIVYIFGYFNLIEGHTRLRYLIYYIVTFVEDFSLILSWYLFAHTQNHWYHYPAMSAVFGGYTIGLTFMGIYYMIFHPNNYEPHRKHKKIRLCLNKSEWLEICGRSVVGTDTHNESIV